jgi:adenosylmethionine-8-amino-7-oxononanoate aminotransferase
MRDPLPPALVSRAAGSRLTLADGREVVDGMSSWWAAIHGYAVPELDAAARSQLDAMAHVMFGGLTHEPAIRLAERLVSLAPGGLDCVFFSDSGSVSVEIAMKMALQYWVAAGSPEKHRFVSPRGGYHGDTFLAMSVCDPVTGMHSLFRGVLPEQIFVDRPGPPFGSDWDDASFDDMARAVREHRNEIAAIIVEPVVQGAGGMRFYSPTYLEKLRALADDHGVLLICDEIATGFGRTGRLFACEHAGIAPDILCLGKALTGGYMTLAATLTTPRIAETISAAAPGALMHGPTFMGNPLACAVAIASIDRLLRTGWRERVASVETALRAGLEPARSFGSVSDVRALGAIGVIELHEPIAMARAQPAFLKRGVWLRPFGKLVYTMPPFNVDSEDLTAITRAMTEVVAEVCGR